MLRNYLKIALKVLRRRKFFTLISLFGIGFTLLVLMVATALLDHVFAPRAPETRMDRTLLILTMGMTGPNGSQTGGAGYGFLDRAVRTMPDVESVAVASLPNVVSVYHEGRKVRPFLRRTDGAFWRIYDFRFLEGGPFTAEDDRDARRVAVINQATRERLFGGEPALGRTFEVDGDRFRIVGVVRNVPITRIIPFSDVWVPIGTFKTDLFRRELVGGFVGVILARSRADFPPIKAEIARRVAETQLPAGSEFDALHGGADTLFEAASREMFSPGGKEASPGRLLGLLIGAMVLFMVLPAVNLINLNLSRIFERSSEIGVRKAFGASSRALVGQFVVENVVLTLLGAVAGLALSAVVLSALNASGFIPYSDFRLNLRIFAYGVFIALFFGVLSGVYPAWRMSRMHPVEALRGRSS